MDYRLHIQEPGEHGGPVNQIATGISRGGELVVIEDNPADFCAYQYMLDELDHGFSEVLHFCLIEEACTYLGTHKPKCCILDNKLPDGNAIDLIKRLNRNGGHTDFPIIVSTGQGNEKLAVELMHLGIQDYLVKRDLNQQVLSQAMHKAIDSFEQQSRLYFQANYDPLTGLINRALFMNRLEQSVNEARRYRRTLQLCYLDVDFFKQINDTHGHAVGDEVLKAVAQRLRHCVRETDSVARLGGDEFVILLPETSIDDGKTVAGKLLTLSDVTVQCGKVELKVNLTIGMSCFPDNCDNAMDLIKQADAALYIAKERGRAQYFHISSRGNIDWRERTDLSCAFAAALRHRELFLVYQPIYSACGSHVTGIESLVRWQHLRKWISPPEILRIVQDSGQTDGFHAWLFHEALTQLQLWQRTQPELKLSLNLSNEIFAHPGIIDALDAEITRLGLAPACVIVEITESRLLGNTGVSRPVLERLAAAGVQIAIDGYGRGHVGIELLADLPFHILKLDMNLLAKVEAPGKTRRIVDAMTTLGKKLGLKIVAPGVDSEHLRSLLEKIGCDDIQGYIHGRPVTAETDFPTYLAKSRKFGQFFATDPFQFAS
ncbi:MAG TPA: EAL domain-containing protein [Candidatus Acidoferrum sp.]|nr:EAL domain-containing protein [Candidatus Acidoferrum sp.]